jgi:chromate transporter
VSLPLLLDLMWRFALVGLLSFGAGPTALALVERTAGPGAALVSATDFAAAVAVGYVAPAPALAAATLVGYRAAGLAGALMATLAVTLPPWAIAAAAAGAAHQRLERPWAHGFSRGAAAGLIGLLGVTALSLAQRSAGNWCSMLIVVAALLVGARTKTHPVLILIGGAVAGYMLFVLPSGAPAG